MAGGDWFCVRPSGTEPKIKVYYGVSAPSAQAMTEALAALREGVLSVIKPMLGL
jgi:phosphoglucomutase